MKMKVAKRQVLTVIGRAGAMCGGGQCSGIAG